MIVQRLRELNAAGEISDMARQLLFAPGRPSEELYEYGVDRWQIKNLADDPKHAVDLKQMRDQLNAWIIETGDLGSESAEVYAQEMEDELSSIKRTSPRYEVFRKNAEMYKRWASEGK